MNLRKLEAMHARLVKATGQAWTQLAEYDFDHTGKNDFDADYHAELVGHLNTLFNACEEIQNVVKVVRIFGDDKPELERTRTITQACLETAKADYEKAFRAVKKAVDHADGDIEDLTSQDLQTAQNAVFYRGRISALEDVLELLEDEDDG